MAESTANTEPGTIEDESDASPGLFGLVDTLLKSPGTLFEDLRTKPKPFFALLGIAVAGLAVSGVVCATTGGGAQFLLVPAKVVFGLLFSALLCLPSLHIFSCLSGSTQNARTTAAALLLGVSLLSVLQVGFAPIAWIFSQATSSVVALGTLNVVFLLISAYFALRLVRRALESVSLTSSGGLVVWSVLFVLVMLQMTTTLRPLVGPYHGHIFESRVFFLEHWFGDTAFENSTRGSLM